MKHTQPGQPFENIMKPDLSTQGFSQFLECKYYQD